MLYIKKEDPIEMLSLSNRSANALRNVGLETIGQLIDFPVDGLTNVKNMGAKSVSEVSSVILSLRQGTNENFCVINFNDAENKTDISKASVKEILFAEEMAAVFGNELLFWLNEIHSAANILNFHLLLPK